MRSQLIDLALKVEAFLDRFKGDRNALQIIPYIGYASQNKAFVHGRVLRNKPLPPITEQDTIWHNLANAYRRFATNEASDIPIKITMGNYSLETHTDSEGFFRVAFKLRQPLARRRYTVRYQTDGKQVTGELFNSGIQARFGIISDLDDTVLKTQVLDPLQMLNNTFFQNAHKRLPFPGVAAFYRALQRQFNPIFYVSSSPWNLYDILIQFFQIRDIPMGTVFLQDYGLEMNQLIVKQHDEHKLAYIRQVMEDFAPLSFILIGDSSQDDPYIYRKVIEDYPDRIMAVYIRDVGSKRNMEELHKLLKESSEVSMLLVKDTYEAAQHAHTQGLLSLTDLNQIYEEMREDKR